LARTFDAVEDSVVKKKLSNPDFQLNLWRQVCQPIRLEESIGSLLGLLQTELHLDHIAIRRIEEDPAGLVTIAHSDPVAAVEIGRKQQLIKAEFRRILTWCQTRLAVNSSDRSAGLLKLLAPSVPHTGVLAIPLVIDRQAKGCLLLFGQSDSLLSAGRQRLVELLAEPFAAAVANESLLCEMGRLREAAEADKGALLRRLGRTDLGDTIIGENTGIRSVMERVNLVADSDVPVLILGETGTGKELIARALHLRGKRSRGPFIRVNCGAIPAELIDSQLFGHEKGSFTGADQSRQGWFERADGGTLFLDEIGELPLEAQVRFLRVLQDGFVERIGGQQAMHVNVRIVAATHRNLPAMISESRFREDLWYRLAVFPVLLPPLRERIDDIQELAHFFAERAAARFGLPLVYPSPAEIRQLQSYDWPGNIRELGAVIDRAAILGNGERLEVAKALGNVGISGGSSSFATSEARTQSLSKVKTDASPDVMSLDDAMRQHIENVLRTTNGRVEGRKGAARLLQVNPHTLRARMRKLKIDWTQFRDE
jgi:hydrogenase-4 transcriptional activator